MTAIEEQITQVIQRLANPGLDLFEATEIIWTQIEQFGLDCHREVNGQSIFTAAIAEDNVALVQRIWLYWPPAPLVASPVGNKYCLIDLTQPEVFTTVTAVVDKAFRWTALSVMTWLLKVLKTVSGYQKIFDQILEQHLTELRDNILMFHLIVTEVKLSNHVQHLISRLSDQVELWDTPGQVLGQLVYLQGYHFAEVEQEPDSELGEASKYQFVETNQASLDLSQDGYLASLDPMGGLCYPGRDYDQSRNNTAESQSCSQVSDD